MTTPERSNETPATPDQAHDLLIEIGTLTTLQGINYGDRNTFGTDLDILPTEVAQHLPAPEPTSTVKQSAYIMQNFDRETGQPMREGVVGMVSFTLDEKPDPDLTYAAHVNYHITTNDGGNSYDLERHVTNTEHGPHTARAIGKTSIDPAKMLEDLISLRDRVEQLRPIEKATGMFTVTQVEAQQVIDFVRELNS